MPNVFNAGLPNQPGSSAASSGGIKRITRLSTAGAGTYVPTENNARCYVFVQASGGGSGVGTANAGPGGAMVPGWQIVPIAGTAYVVGAAGAIASAGNLSSFGTILAQPGINTEGGVCGNGIVATKFSGGSNGGVPGGGVRGGSAPGKGGAAGFPAGNTDCAQNGFATFVASTQAGGDSYFGKGGNGATGVGGAPTGYGAGAGTGTTTGQVGGVGYIEIWDYGAE